MSMLGTFKAWVASSLAQPQPWLRDMFSGGRSVSGRAVTPDSAMRASAVYACVSVLAQSMGSLPLTLYKRKGDKVEPAYDHSLYPLLKMLPNEEMTTQELRELLMTNLCLRGTSYKQAVRVGGQVVAINALPFDYIRMERDEEGNLIYRYTPLNGTPEIFSRGQIWRTIGLSFNGLQGLTPIQCAKEAIGLALATEEHGARMFSNGVQAPIFAQFPGKLSPEAADRVSEKISARYSGNANAWKVPVLQEGMELKRIGMTAADSQFIEGRKFQIEEIARMFRVPLHLIGSLDRSTNNNIEHQGIDFVTHTLVPYATRIEQSATRDLLLPSERNKYFLKHNFAGLLRGDQKSRYEAYASAITAGWMNRNEARALEDMNEQEGLDIFLTPLAMGDGSKTPSDPVKDEGAQK